MKPIHKEQPATPAWPHPGRRSVRSLADLQKENELLRQTAMRLTSEIGELRKQSAQRRKTSIVALGNATPPNN